jgi:hypothetical protein
LKLGQRQALVFEREGNGIEVKAKQKMAMRDMSSKGVRRDPRRDTIRFFRIVSKKRTMQHAMLNIQRGVSARIRRKAP